MSGPTIDEFEDSQSAEQTIISGTNLIEKVILNQGDIAQGKRRKKVSCDIGMEDAMEGLIGGNFNTFGEQSSNDVIFQKRKSLEEDNDFKIKGNLIERIEHQIETELKQSKDASSTVYQMFEVNEQLNNSIGTQESNTNEMMVAPPQNSLKDVHHLHPSQDTLLDTIQSKEVSGSIGKQRQTTMSHNSGEQTRSNLQNFHYSGSFGIPEPSTESPNQEKRL